MLSFAPDLLSCAAQLAAASSASPLLARGAASSLKPIYAD
jgi:hypothetical protein